MPLITITGMPCTGKTFCAQQLKEHFTKLNKNVILISEHDFIKNKNCIYNSSNEEKTLRASIKAAVLRGISNSNLVVLDASNYIKGYRYELYCVSKQHSTPQCVVQCVTPLEEAWQRNTEKDSACQYTKDTFDALVYRYEAPDSRNRWDAPLFLALPSIPLNMAEVEAALYSGRAVKPHQATQLQPLTDCNFLHDLDKCTQEVVSAILAAQNTEAGGEITITGSRKMLDLGRKVALPELSRARRQFITYCKSRPQQSGEDVTTCFVTYLNTTLA